MASEPPEDVGMVDTYARPRTLLIDGIESVSIIGSRQPARPVDVRARKVLVE